LVRDRFVADAENLTRQNQFLLCKSGGRSKKASEKFQELDFKT
jgi:rhodanese-related sulfurtransferase